MTMPAFYTEFLGFIARPMMSDAVPTGQLLIAGHIKASAIATELISPEILRIYIQSTQIELTLKHARNR